MNPSVVVSGASRGLGLALCDDLSRDHTVTGFARAAALSPDSGDHAWDFRGGVDVSDRDSWEPLMVPLAAADVLVNNVGVAHDGLLATQGGASVERIIDVNLTSVLLLTKTYLRLRLAQRKPGVIVNISSIIGIRGYAGLAAYSASKGGVDAMTRALAREMGPKGFRVNSVLPGYFDSELSSTLDTPQRKQIVNRTPLGRLATTGDIVPVVRFLISDGAGFVTGQTLVVDGGITV